MNPYEQMQRTELEGRELEASVLSRAANKLNRCAQNWDHRNSPEVREKFEDALAFTQRLWTFLQVEMTNIESLVPESVRKNVFQLSCYVDQTIATLYSGGSLEDLKSLIDVNREMAAGLLVNRPDMYDQSGARAGTGLGITG
ncbi:MAG: flagellar biosynthesis regulator FlaF [Acidobacteriota bacterium]